MAYLYETHIHTKESSSCGVSRGREYIRKYLDLGYTGIIVTDHFFNGNCTGDRNLPWDKWVNEFSRGYEHARDEGERRGLDVFFGWEESFGMDDYLIYGLSKEWLLEHPEVCNWTREKQFAEVRHYGGCVVHAHPFRHSYSIGQIKLFPDLVDAVEAANSGNEQFADVMARAYANKHKKPITAGSDIHYAGDIRPWSVFGVFLDKKMETVNDYVNAVRNNTIKDLKITDGRFNFCGEDVDKVLLEKYL